MDSQRGGDPLVPLRELAALQEHRFSSKVPLLGGLIAAFRRAWNNVSTRWYVAPALQQQSTFNELIVDRLAATMAGLEQQAAQLAQLQSALGELRSDTANDQAALRTELTRLQEWLIEQDREQTELRHDLGELAVFAGQLVRLHESTNSQRQQPEATQTTEPTE